MDRTFQLFDTSLLDSSLFDSSVNSPNQSTLPCTVSVREDRLFIGDYSIRSLVERFGSPLYILDETHFRWGCREFVQALASSYPAQSKILFATKSLCTQAVCKIALQEGLGLDVVSEGELITALSVGGSGEMVYLHGNNKSRSELLRAVSKGCTIILDNWYELDILRDIIESSNSAIARVMPRITPEVESHTYDEVRTGQRDSKFGFCLSDLDRLFSELSTLRRFDFVGIHAHLGSQLLTVEPFKIAARVMVDYFARAKSVCPSVRELNIGGGLGVAYLASEKPPTIGSYVETLVGEIVTAAKEKEIELPTLVIEPGRAIAAPAMITAYTTGGIKEIPGVRRYVSVDGGMSDNPRPITYKSRHTVYHADRPLDNNLELVTIAGRHCESGDILFKDINIPKLRSGDIIVAATTGAYNYSQSSNYNRVPRPAMLLVSDSGVDVIVQRETVEEMMQKDVVPERLQG